MWTSSPGLIRTMAGTSLDAGRLNGWWFKLSFTILWFQVEDISSCSHSRSHELYLFSVSDPCIAIQTCTDSTVIPATCTNITTNAPVMGYWVDKTIRGKVYTVQTGAVAPFCNTSALIVPNTNLEILLLKNYKTETRKNNQLWKVKQNQIRIYKAKFHQKKKNIRYKWFRK